MDSVYPQYSIVCETGAEGTTNKVEFTSGNGKVHTEYGAPYYLDGDNGDYVVPAEYLQTCGTVRVSVVGGRWSEDCFSASYTLTGDCSNEDPCNQINEKLVSGHCVRNWCKKDLVCPENSQRKPNRKCYNSFSDCECRDGFRKHGNSCIA